MDLDIFKHPYHVYNRGTFIGAFSNLQCAASTAVAIWAQGFRDGEVRWGEGHQDFKMDRAECSKLIYQKGEAQ